MYTEEQKFQIALNYAKVHAGPVSTAETFLQLMSKMMDEINKEESSRDNTFASDRPDPADCKL